MSVLGGRGGRTDDWATPHDRARARSAERLIEPLDPDEGGWLDEHLASCLDCRAAADAFAAQRQELRALRDRPPTPPRDLWARTASAIEKEAGFRRRASPRRNRQSLLAPIAVLSGALVVAVVVGTLISSQRSVGDATAASSGPGIAASHAATALPGPTPLTIANKRVEWISQGNDGSFRIQVANVGQVCPAGSSPCDKTAASEDHPVAIQDQPQTVFRSPTGDELIVVADSTASKTANVSVVRLDAKPTTGPSPSPSVSVRPSPSASPPSSASASPRVTPSPSLTPPGASPTPSTSPSVAITPSPSLDGTIQIATNVRLVGQSASYSRSGKWFGFTARPADGSLGPDIYVWRVGDPQARPLTTDHRSSFGSWDGERLVGSRTVDDASTTTSEAFIADPTSGVELQLRGVARAWRPSVNPSGTMAVYWTGTLRRQLPGSDVATDAGRLVLGPWRNDAGVPTSSSAPASDGQKESRQEVALANGRIADWDARWDQTGTRLAVWIAEGETAPTVGRLSLYRIDPTDGSIDLQKPLLKDEPALAGYSISDGRIVWAEPDAAGSANERRIFVLAWTENGSGTVESIPGQVTVIR